MPAAKLSRDTAVLEVIDRVQVLGPQGLPRKYPDRRILDAGTLKGEIQALEADGNLTRARINWAIHFTDARNYLSHLHPTVSNWPNTGLEV